MKYEVRLTLQAERAFSAIPPGIRNRIGRAIEKLQENPRPAGSLKLAGLGNAYRVRVGDYRILYEIYDTALLIMVFKFGHRRDIYR